MEDVSNSRCNGGGIGRPLECDAGAACGDPDRCITLVPAVWQQHHRHAGRERLHDGAMSAMRDDGGRMLQHLTMGCVGENGHIGRGVQRRGVDRGTGRDDAMNR